MKDACDHPHGDTVNGYWLCGKCYQKLAERPFSLILEDGRTPHGGGYSPRQNVVHAKISRDEYGRTLSQFIEAMLRRVMARSGMKRTDALNYAIDLMEMQGEEFGSSDCHWGAEGAWEVVDADMQNWDRDEEEDFAND